MNKIFTLLIRFYQLTLSPIFSSLGCGCRFYPSCSVYAKNAYGQYGWFKATGMMLSRLIRCHPFNKDTI